MNEIYVIEECLAPGVWALLSDVFYNSFDEAGDALSEIANAMLKYKKRFNGRVTKLNPYDQEG